MKKNFRFYIAAWAVLLALFIVISFVSVGWADTPKYTPSFWIGFAFTVVAFCGQLFCSWYALKDENLAKRFYDLPLVTVSYTGMIVMFVVGGLCMLISPLPYWLSAIACAIVLAVNAIAVFKAAAAANIVEEIDKNVKVKTFFIKSLTVDADTLMASARSDAVKAECRRVYEAVRYSDPMSSDALAGVESQITLKFSEFSNTVTADDPAAAKATADALLVLVGDRNKKCKLLK